MSAKLRSSARDGRISNAPAGGPEADAFSRIRVSEGVTLFDSQFQYDSQPLLWEYTVATNGTAVHSTTNACMTLTTSTDSGSSAIAQTRQYFRYQPGKSQLVFCTFVLGAATANIRKRVGYFDAQNGIFLEQNGTTDLALVVRTAGSDASRVTQTSWNLDQLNSNSPSGNLLDLSAAQILVIDFQWLGVGRVRVGFDLNGEIVYAHEFLHANSVTDVYMKTPNLPVRYEITNTGVAAGQSMKAICSAVLSEGGFEEGRGFLSAVSSTTAGLTAATRRAILSVRPSGTFNGVVNRSLIVPESLEVALNGSGVGEVELVYDATFTTAATYSSVSTISAMDYTYHAEGGGFSGGTTLWKGFVSSSGATAARGAVGKDVSSRLPLVLNAAGTSTSGKSLSIVCTTLTGTPSYFGALNWREIR